MMMIMMIMIRIIMIRIITIVIIVTTNDREYHLISMIATDCM